MIIPKDFKEAVAGAFYDKEINRIGETLITEEDGATRTEIGAITGTFVGNPKLSNFKKVQEEYGLDYQIDIVITTSTDVLIDVDEVIQYDNVMYKVTDVLPFDSHKTIVGAIWTQK